MKPAHDAPHVAIDDGLGPVEGNASNRPCSVSSHPGQLQNVFELSREFAVMLSHNYSCGPLQISGPAVISETRPGGQHVLLRRFGQCPDIGEPSQEPFIIGKNRLDLGLLQHGLGNPDAIGRGMAAPRELAPMPLVPVQEQVLELPNSLPGPGFCFHAGTARTQRAPEGGKNDQKAWPR